jgi:protein TonB
VIFYDNASSSAATHVGRSAVAVALVPAADDPSFAAVDTPKILAEQNAAKAESRAQDQKPSVAPAAPPAVKSPRAVAQEAEISGQAADVVEEPVAEAVSTETVCLDPRQSLPDHQAETISITGEAAAHAQSGVADVSGREDQGGPPEESHAVDSGAAGSAGDVLVEAMPNYRNNPLPEYPYIARQRHWEGVVWLVVDVSAEGLVDDVDVERSCGYRTLDRSARKTVQSWQFTPAMRAGLPVESQVRIPVRFSLEES